MSGLNQLSPRHPEPRSALASIDGAITSRGGLLAAIATYVVVAIAIGIHVPGLQFDEAIFAHGGIHLLTSADAPPFAYNQGTWIKVGDRHVPLMVIPYIGSATFVLHAIAFAIFGTSAVTVRAVNLLLGAVGIWGVGRFGQSRLSPRLGTALAFILAIHPGYLTWTMYDNAGMAIWMATLGVGCLAVARYLGRFDGRSALLLGVWLGFAVWCRANYVWLLGGVIVALALLLRGRLLPTARHWPSIVLGGIIGSSPLIAYEVASRLGTLKFIQAMSSPVSPLHLVPERLAVAAQALVYDSLRRVIWEGPGLPVWQVAVFAALLVGSIAVCLLAADRTRPREEIGKIAALTLTITIVLTLTSRIRLGPYHFLVYFPVAAFVVLAAGRILATRWRAARILAVAIGIGYAAVALSWDVRTAIGMRQSGGSDMWSDAVFAVASTIETKYRGKTISILDWGLTNNLYVLTSAGFRPRELYWGSTAERTGLGTSWPEEISRGGIYLLNGPANAFNRAAGEAFRQAVGQSGLRYLREEFRQRNGRIYAELYEITGRPITAGTDTDPQTRPASRRIVELFPSTIVVGQVVNKQPDGSSAIAIRGTGFSHGDRIYWNGQELVTAYGTPELLSALIPEKLLRQPGAVRISIRDVLRPEIAELVAELKIAR
jgi:hypothetical protein